MIWLWNSCVRTAACFLSLPLSSKHTHSAWGQPVFVLVEVVGGWREVALHLHPARHHVDSHAGSQALLQLLQHAWGQVTPRPARVFLDGGIHLGRRVRDLPLQVHDELVDAALVQWSGCVTVARHHMGNWCFRRHRKEIVGLLFCRHVFLFFLCLVLLILHGSRSRVEHHCPAQPIIVLLQGLQDASRRLLRGRAALYGLVELLPYIHLCLLKEVP